MENRGQADRLQRHGLAARVRAADDERPQVAEVEVDWNDRLARKQRMTDAEQPDLVGHLDGAAAPAPRKRSACECEIDRGGRVDEHLERVRPGPDERRELGQDALDLLALGARGLGELVVQLDDRERLDEQRLPGARRVVDDPADLVPRAQLDRQHGPAATVGHERLLKVLAKLGRPRQPCQLVGHALPPGPELVAQPAQERRRGVAQPRAVLLDAPVDVAADRGQGRIDRSQQVGEQRCRLALLRERAPCGQRDGDRRGDRTELAGLQRAAALGPARLRTHVGRALKRRGDSAREQRDRLGGQGLPSGDLGRIRRRHEVTRQRGAVGRHRGVGESLDDQRVFEHGKCLPFHGGPV